MITSRQTVLRFAGALVVASTLGARAFAQAASDTIVGMGRYLTAVVQLLSGTNQRVDGIDVLALDAGTRTELRAELESLVHALGSLLVPKGIFVQDLRGYLRLARSDGFDSAERRQHTWRSI